jgi:carboxyl-terminal processing protease
VRRTAAAVLAVVLGTLAARAAAGAAQDARAWRDTGLASFDEVWQTIADTYYDPSFGGVDWNAARTTFRKNAEAAGSPDEIRRAIVELLARLERSHFVLLSSSEGFDTSPMGPAAPAVDVRVTADGVVIAGVSGPAGDLAPGHVITAIDEVSTEAWKSTGASAEARRQAFAWWRQSERLLHGPEGTEAVLRVRSRDGSSRTVRAVRQRPRGEVVTLGNLPSLSVTTDVREVPLPRGRRAGVIRFNLWMTAIDAPVAAAIDRFRGADGLVFDLRGNPGGLAAMMSGIAGHLTAEPVLLGRMLTRQAQLEFRANPRLATTDGRRVRPFEGRVAILVDELTGSTSECFAGALQDLRRARIFGRQTMGQALPALTKRLPSGDVLMYVIGNFETATGRSLEGEGVIPDETVPLTIPGLSAGRDEALEAALRWLEGG